jgi:hypothetical protein
MAAEVRTSIDNGIWLCQNCAKLVDNDALAYSVDILRAWRALAEATSKSEIERGITVQVDQRFSRVERDMPQLLAEMRVDLKDSPLARRFVCMKKAWSVWTDALRYYSPLSSWALAIRASSAMMSLQTSTHSSQMKTGVGPAISFLT